METLSRRRLLQAGAVGAAASIAGCSSLGDGGDDGSTSNQQTLTVAAGLGQEASQSIQQEARTTQQEAQQQLQAGEINQTEAQSRIQQARLDAQQARQEQITESVAAIETYVEETDGLTVVESAPESGLLLVEGDPDELVQLPARSEVSGLLPEDQYEALQQSAGAGSQ